MCMIILQLVYRVSEVNITTASSHVVRSPWSPYLPVHRFRPRWKYISPPWLAHIPVHCFRPRWEENSPPDHRHQIHPSFWGPPPKSGDRRWSSPPRVLTVDFDRYYFYYIYISEPDPPTYSTSSTSSTRRIRPKTIPLWWWRGIISSDIGFFPKIKLWIFAGLWPQLVFSIHQETWHCLVYLFHLFHLIPCHLNPSKTSKSGLGLYNVNDWS
jgi:hypothetical protein